MSRDERLPLFEAAVVDRYGGEDILSGPKILGRSKAFLNNDTCRIEIDIELTQEMSDWLLARQISGQVYELGMTGVRVDHRETPIPKDF